MRHLIQDKIDFDNFKVFLKAYFDTIYESINVTSTITTTNNTITDIYTFTPVAGATLIGVDIKGFQASTGDTILIRGFAGFKSIGGVVTQISTQSIDRKSNFPASVTVTIDTDGTVIRVRVTGRAASTILWTSITKTL